MKGNFGFASQLLDTLKKHNNKAGIMLSSSVQATLAGALEIVNTEGAKRQGKSYFLHTEKRQVLLYMCTDL